MNIKQYFLATIATFLGVGALHADPMSAPAVTAKPSNHISNLMDKNGSNLKIGFVESFTAMRTCDQGVESGGHLEQQYKKLEKEIQAEEKALMEKKMMWQAQAPTLNAKARAEAEQTVREMEIALKTKVERFDREMKGLMQESTEALAESVNKAAAEVAKSKGFDALIDTATGQALYVASHVNLTTEVVNNMNTERRVQLAKNKQNAETNTIVAANKDKAVNTVDAKNKQTAEANTVVASANANAKVPAKSAAAAA